MACILIIVWCIFWSLHILQIQYSTFRLHSDYCKPSSWEIATENTQNRKLLIGSRHAENFHQSHNVNSSGRSLRVDDSTHIPSSRQHNSQHAGWCRMHDCMISRTRNAGSRAGDLGPGNSHIFPDCLHGNRCFLAVFTFGQQVCTVSTSYLEQYGN